MTKNTRRNILKTLFFTSSSLFAFTANAGGYLTNTNQSVAFLRNPSQDAIIGISALYNNPAGVTFLNDGFHIALNIMNVHQNRDITATYAPFAFGADNGGSSTKKYCGNAVAPVLPSLQASYNADRWAFSFHFGVVGGGGKCEFASGLPSIESKVSALSIALADYGFGNYKYDTYMYGRNYQFGFQLGAGHKLNDKLSIYGGLRLVYATNNYFGYIKNIRMQYVANNTYYTAREFTAFQHEYIKQITAAGYVTAEEANAMHTKAQQLGYVLQDNMQNIGLNCNQHGWGVTPVIGADWKVNEKINLAAKIELKTRIRLDNQSWNENTEGKDLDNYEDGLTVAEDVPAIVNVGAQYSPIKALRLNGGFHYYFDKQATKAGGKNKKLNGGTWEITGGVEYDINSQWTVSAGWHNTNYPNTDDYMNDISFVTNSNSVGFGAKCRISDAVAVEAGYFQTFYSSYSCTKNNLTSKYDRKNRVIGAALTLDM